jgi:Spy/CpxP family protein refolding chaperone
MRFALCSLLSIVFAACHLAAQETKEKKKADPGANAQVFQLPKDIQLNAEQQAKLDALKKEYGPKVAELQKQLNEILTPEQRKAREEAAAQIKEEKLDGKERQQKILAALKLTPEQQEKWDTAQKRTTELNVTIRGKIGEFLTDEQRAKVPGLTKKKKA